MLFYCFRSLFILSISCCNCILKEGEYSQERNTEKPKRKNFAKETFLTTFVAAKFILDSLTAPKSFRFFRFFVFIRKNRKREETKNINKSLFVRIQLNSQVEILSKICSMVWAHSLD